MLSWAPPLPSSLPGQHPKSPDVNASDMPCRAVAMATGDVRVSLDVSALLGPKMCGVSTSPVSVMLLAGVDVHLGSSISSANVFAQDDRANDANILF